MHQKSTRKGLLGVLGIWLTAGLALPFVNVLDQFTPPQLMVFRGYLTALIALIGLRGTIGKVDKYTYLIAITLLLATLGLFEGIRYWGAGPTIIIVSATPIVNMIIGLFIGRKVMFRSVLALVLLLGGIIIARWGGTFNWVGFAWSVFATVMNGILYEWFGRSQAKPMQKSLWGSIGMGSLGLILSWQEPWTVAIDNHLAMIILSWCFVGGFLYWLVNLLAFDNLPTTEASVLAQGETPAVILGAMLLLGEQMTTSQWIGVAVALLGASYLSYSLAKQANK